MARNAVARTDKMDTLSPSAGVTEPVYEIEAGALMHHEIQTLATEITMEKEAARRNVAPIEAKIAEINNRREAEKNRQKQVEEVESKVTRIIPEPQGYRNRIDASIKADEAELKSLEAELAEVNRLEDNRNEFSRNEYNRMNEPRKIEARKEEHKSNEQKRNETK